MATKIFIITGAVHEGKTTFAHELLKILRQHKLNVYGILAKGNFKDNKRYRFDLQDIETGEQRFLASTDQNPEFYQYRRFYFDTDCLNWGNSIISAMHDKKDLLIIDEVGPMELQGLGWAEGIKKSLLSKAHSQIWVVREEILQKIQQYFGIHQASIIHCTRQSPKDAALQIIGHSQEQNGHGEPKNSEHL